MRPTQTQSESGNSATVPDVPLDPDLERALKRAAKKASNGTSERDDLIVRAFNEGASLREIARAVGMTHPGVRRIVLRDQPDESR